MKVLVMRSRTITEAVYIESPFVTTAIDKAKTAKGLKWFKFWRPESVSYSAENWVGRERRK